MLTIPLHPYQDVAVDRLLERRSLLLAYDMGLGKTITSIAAAEELLGSGEIDQALIVVPSGLKIQWAVALAARTDVATREITAKGEVFQIPEERYAVVIDGGPAKRREQYGLIKELRPQYVIAGYKTVVAELRTIRRMRPGLIILDEATAIKNPSADITQAVRQLDAGYRLALTGTPVDNRLEELFQLMGWVDQSVLGDPDDPDAARIFDQAYIDRDDWGSVKGYRNTPTLHAKVSPALIRKRTTDPDVAPYMPKIDHRTWSVTMEPATAAVYKLIAADLAAELAQMPTKTGFDVGAHYSGTDENTPAGRVMAVHLAAQQLITDPEMMVDSESSYVRNLVASGVLEGLPESAKLVRLRAEVEAILSDPSEKVILVTRFRSLLAKLGRIFEEHEHVFYHGGMNPSEKQASVNRFQDRPEARLFLMSHAGAYGVDIPAATHLINLDPARSAGQRAQINHRHVRAGSRNKIVMVSDLITRDSVEERSYQRLDLRARVGSAVVDGVGADETGTIIDDVTSLTEHLSVVLSG
ncbi:MULTISPECIES: DEAD/DEAH box helicase [Streptosporangium]|uniref:SNF2 family DNA or RNA helicase n=1 Tax=Streptosporangium brasiliense TaxID=47480 RepID=A0ABT9RQ05_9ACTN|nr:DEAD/DEAH box helicase [Streptosporangium brasiliense]MDP9870445.1 SNF2 family DNA or RNA helicase [Streptosporangium brasiliense]